VITSRFWGDSQTNNSNYKNFWDGKGKAKQLISKGFHQKFHKPNQCPEKEDEKKLKEIE
jgi:hypothetical protein